MHKIEEVQASIGMAEYCQNYRNIEHFLEFCKECNGYGKSWACPPFEQQISIEQYEYAHIFGTKIWVNSPLQGAQLSKEQLQAETSKILNPIRAELDDKILELERLNDNSRALFPGSCKGCHWGECTRLIGKPCVKPDRMRPSLEAMGFDVGRTTSELLDIELQWSSDHLPQYFTLVYALFSNGSIRLI